VTAFRELIESALDGFSAAAKAESGAIGVETSVFHHRVPQDEDVVVLRARWQRAGLELGAEAALSAGDLWRASAVGGMPALARSAWREVWDKLGTEIKNQSGG